MALAMKIHKYIVPSELRKSIVLGLLTIPEEVQSFEGSLDKAGFCSYKPYQSYHESLCTIDN